MESCNAEFAGHISWNMQPDPKINQREGSKGHDGYGGMFVVNLRH